MEVAGDWVPKNPPATPMPVLEINLISAQGLKVPSNRSRPRHTYAVAWVDPANRLRTRLDTIGGENPTWNDKFLFRVSPEFLARETSAVSIEIYALGRFSDSLVGTVRFLIGNVIASNDCSTTPAFTAVQVRRPSGRFQGVLNIGVMVTENSDLASLNGVSAIGYRDLMGESFNRRRRTKSKVWGSEISLESHDAESPEMSDGSESSSSSACSPSEKSNVLRDLNGIRNLGGTKTLKPSKSTGFLCGLVMQKKTTAADDLPRSGKSFKVSRGSADMER
ncbi:uncharacterized protein LOC120070201 [Benincasa hispida]|uniref:uncharacterized protein LOC120070201 n=1 Tax=Benincasa hispida TaxID=102211 RepID=UPI001900B659|nr:uncharacterized protein LOC120070201 [Benincasa hispida]